MDEDFDAARGSKGSLVIGLVLVAALGAGGYAFITAMAPSYDPAELMSTGVSMVVSGAPTSSTMRSSIGACLRTPS